MTQYSKMTFEEFVAYAKDYTIDGCHPQIVDEAIARLNSLHEDNKELKTENQILSQKRFNIFERMEYSGKLKNKTYEEIIEYLESRFPYKMPLTATGYECAIIEIKNLLKEKENEVK